MVSNRFWETMYLDYSASLGPKKSDRLDPPTLSANSVDISPMGCRAFRGALAHFGPNHFLLMGPPRTIKLFTIRRLIEYTYPIIPVIP